MIGTDRAGKLPPRPGVFPNIATPIVHVAEGQHMLSICRWAMPWPAIALEGKLVDPSVVNVRNTGSPHERRRHGPRHGIGYGRLSTALGEE